MTPADVCVIIPTLNEAAGIEETLQSASAAGQVIVVDAGSTDGTTDLVQRFANAILMSAARGRGNQLRVGARQCALPIMVFLHGDCRLSRDALTAIANAVTQGQRWGALRQEIDAIGTKYRWLEKGNAARVRWLGKPFGDQAIFVESALYHEVGGFEAIPLMEDVRLSRRLRARCWPALLHCTVRVNARRWEHRGVLKQTLRNLTIQMLHAMGASPEWLARIYR